VQLEDGEQEEHQGSLCQCNIIRHRAHTDRLANVRATLGDGVGGCEGVVLPLGAAESKLGGKINTLNLKKNNFPHSRKF
jgi:hypothetical protein